MKKQFLISLISIISVIVLFFSYNILHDRKLADSGSLSKVLFESELFDTELTDSELLDTESCSLDSDYGQLDIIELDSSIKILNDNMPYFSEEDKKRLDSFEIYSELDHLG